MIYPTHRRILSLVNGKDNILGGMESQKYIALPPASLGSRDGPKRERNQRTQLPECATVRARPRLVACQSPCADI